MDALLDPTFVCDKNVKDTLRPKTSRWRGTWQQMNYAWDVGFLLLVLYLSLLKTDPFFSRFVSAIRYSLLRELQG